MDPKLAAEHRKFKARATNSLSVINQQQSSAAAADNSNEQRQLKYQNAEKEFEKLQDLSTSSTRFGNLARIIQFLKIKYQQGSNEYYSLKDIANELAITLNQETFKWLQNNALISNPKVKKDATGTCFAYSPKYVFRSASELLLTLRALHLSEGTGIPMEDIYESLPKADSILESIKHRVHIVKSNKEKNQVIFYKDPENKLEIDDEIKQAWNSIKVDSLDSWQLESYLKSKGHPAIKDTSIEHLKSADKTKKNQRKIRKLHNEHLDSVLEDFNE